MSERPVIDIPVLNVALIAVSPDPAGDILIGLETGAEADIRLRLSAPVLAQLEAMIARASLEQAKRMPKQ
jgi:hypothetical protein